MKTITFYPIGTKVKLDDVTGIITQIKFTGEKYQIAYLVSRTVDHNHLESWMYAMEFKSSGHKIKMKFTIGSI